MLKFLSKVKLEFNALDVRAGACMEFLAQCSAGKTKESNPACQVEVKRRTDDNPPQIKVTFVNGVEEVFDASTTSAQSIRSLILEKGQYLETEQMFRDAGEAWPVIIPEEELRQPAPGIKGKQMNTSEQNCILSSPFPLLKLLRKFVMILELLLSLVILCTFLYG